MNESQKCAWERERERSERKPEVGERKRDKRTEIQTCGGGRSERKAEVEGEREADVAGGRSERKAEVREEKQTKDRIGGGERMKARNDERIEIRPLKERSSKSKKVNCQSIRNNPK